MSTAQSAQIAGPPPFLHTVRATVWIVVSLAGGACGITLLYLGMRSVMDIGGACAEGGPFVIDQPCPKGVPLMVLGGIWGAIIMVGIYVWQTIKNKVPSLVGLAWSALFLPLGWNFLDYGLDPPYGEGLVWGWLVCAFFFAIMGGLPLLFVVKPVLNGFVNPKPEPERIKPLPVGELKARLAGRSGTKRPGAQKAARKTAAQPKSAWATLRDMGTRPSTAAASGEPSDEEEMVAALERLQYLHRSGALTAEEFAAAKARVIEGES